MSIYGLFWGIASSVAAPMGGFLSDIFGPKYIWYGAALIGVLVVYSFLLLDRVVRYHQSLVNLGG